MTPPGSPSFVPPPGTLVFCLATLATAVAQTIWGWDRVAQAIGVEWAPSSVSAWIGIHDGQAIPAWLTLVTYVFPHGGWWHVLPNMIAFWIFGTIVERAIGTWRFVAGYIVSGVVGVFCYALVVPNATRPLAGASLAIAGMLGAYTSWWRSYESRSGYQRLLTLGLELAAVAGVVTWLAVRSLPAAPDRASSVIYHFVPFLVMWLAVQAYGGARNLCTGGCGTTINENERRLILNEQNSENAAFISKPPRGLIYRWKN